MLTCHRIYIPYMCVCIVYVYIYMGMYRRTQDPWVRGADGLLLTAEIARETSCITSPSPSSPQGVQMKARYCLHIQWVFITGNKSWIRRLSFYQSCWWPVHPLHWRAITHIPGTCLNVLREEKGDFTILEYLWGRRCSLSWIC